MQKLLKNIKNNLAFLLMTFIGMLVCILTFIFESVNKGLDYALDIHKCIGIIVIIFLVIIFSYLVNKAFKNNLKLEKIFLIFIIPIGLLYMFIIPIGRVPDETNHFLRSYEVSKFRLFSQKENNKYGGDYLPDNLSQVFDDNYKYELNNIKVKASENEKFTIFPNTAIYSFINYLPQAIGVFIGRIFNLPILWIALLGRLTDFIVWTTLMYFSIKLIPFKKLSLLIMMFSPMMLQEAASLSADALTNGITFFFVAYILYLSYQKKNKITNKELLILSVSALVVSVCKIVYLPLCLLVFLIPSKRFKSKKDKYTKIAMLALLVIMMSGFFFFISSGYNNFLQANVNTQEQLQNIINNPATYVLTIFHTIYNYLDFYLDSFIGKSICWYDVSINSVFSVIIWISFITTIILDSAKIDSKNRIWPFIVIVLVMLLIFTSEYLTWTPVGKYIIEGIQGRYFIPLIIPFIMLFNINDVKYNLNKIYKYLFASMIFVNISALITLFVAHMV